VARPKVSWRVLASISFTLFLGQFLSQAFAIAHGVPVGLSSVIVQSQALFTIGFAALLFGERPSVWQTVGIAIATVGLLMICGTVGYDFSIAAFAILMISPLSFAAGNLLLRRAPDVPMFDLFAWLCLVAAVPLLLLTLVSNGPQPTWHALTHMSLTGLMCVIGLGAVSTSIAYWLWGGCCGIIQRRRWCRSRCWCRSSVRPHRAWCSVKPLDRCGSPGWSRWWAASPSCCCRSVPGIQKIPSLQEIRLQKIRLQKNKFCQRSREAPCHIRF
jgi:hypothetical protein